MQIRSLAVTGFKCHQHFAEFHFSQANQIEGDNFAGKSTIGEAICWGLYGVDLFGSNQSFDRLLNNKSKEASVTIEFEHEGSTHLLDRSRKGSTSVVVLDGYEAKQAEVDKLLPDVKLFLSIFNIHYFQGLNNKDARELLMKQLPPIKPEDVVSKLSAPEQEALNGYTLFSPDKLLKEWRDDIKNTELEESRVKGQLDVLQSQLNTEIPLARDFDQARLNDLQQLVVELKSNPHNKANLIDTSQLEKNLNATGAQYRLLEKQLKELQSTPVPTAGSRCETCGQEISKEHTHSVAQSKQMKHTELVAQMEVLKLQGIKVKNELDECQIRNAEIQRKQISVVQKQIQDVEAEHQELVVRKQEVANHNERRRSLIQLQKDAQAQIDGKEKYLETLATDKVLLQQKIEALKNYVQKYAELQNEVVKPYLQRTVIRLTKLVKSSGELKPDFELLFDGKEQRVLSTSETILLGLEISGMFNQITGLKAPMFIDYRESITDKNFVAPDVQYFTAKVVPDAPLSINQSAEEVA